MWQFAAITVFLLLPLAGALLLFLGFRGPRVDALPRCARCRFETSGLAAGVPCPECGAELSGRKSIVIGQRRKRPIAITTGILLLSLAAALTIGVFVFGINNTANNPSKPNWLLQIETRRSDARLAAAAITELAARIGTPAMPAETAQNLRDRALVAQADLNTPWLPEWGDLILACRRAGLCDDPTYQRFFRQSLVFSWTPRPIVRAGLQVPVGFSHSAPRLSSQLVSFHIEEDSLNYNGIPQRSGGGRSSMTTNNTYSGSSFTQIPAIKAPGEVVITQKYRVQILENTQSQSVNPALSWIETFTSTIQVASTDATLIETDSTAAPDALRAGLSIQSLELFDWGGSDSTGLHIMVNSGGNLPIDLAGTLHAFWTMPDGHEMHVELGTIAFSPDTHRGSAGGLPSFTLPPNFTPTHARIVLRPDTSAAEETVTITRIYFGPELAFENVPITDRRTKPDTP